MTKLFIPDLKKHQRSGSFFAELIETNKKKNSRFSHRYLASKLKWPISYVADLIHGRKQLTIARALEFSKFANFNLLDTEKMIFLALSESPNLVVRDFFLQRLAIKQSKTAEAYKRTTSSDKVLFEDIETGAVFEILKWARRPLHPSEIKKLLFTFRDLSTERIEEIIQALKRSRFIEIKDGQLKVLQPELIWDQFDESSDGGIKIHKKYAENFIRYSENPIFPGLFTSGFVEIPKGQFNEVAKKILEMRNWLLQYSLENNLTSKSNLTDSKVFQFDLNLVLMIDTACAQALDQNL